MTAETLKPFITPLSMERRPTAADQQNVMTRKSKSVIYKILPIALSTITFVLGIGLLVFAIWMFMYISKLESKVQQLETDLNGVNKLAVSMKNRLGLNYLDDINDLKEFTTTFTEEPKTFEENSKEKNTDRRVTGDEDYEDDEEKYDTYDELVKHYSDLDQELDQEEDPINYEDEINDEGDNFYSDHVKFQDSQKKARRKARSLKDNKNEAEVEIVEESKDIGNSHASYRRPHFDHFVANRQRTAPKYPFLHKKTHRRRKSPLIKSGDSELSAKSKFASQEEFGGFRAAHFQLNRKVHHKKAKVQVDSYHGDVYIGDSVWDYDQAHFSAEDGVLKMHEPGLYYVYAQICYNNTFDHNGFLVFHGHKPFLQCLNTVPTNFTSKIHTCHTSGLIYLKANETLHIRDLQTERNVILKESNNRSFFGLIKIK